MDLTFRRSEPAVMTLCVVAMLPIFWLAWRYTVPAEDSVILYEYARNLARTGVISYGQSGFPIEGATDFLWMVMIAALKKIGVPEFLSALALNFAGAVIILSQLQDNRARLVALAAMVTTPYLYASLGGFSTLLFSAVYVLCLAACLRRTTALYPLILTLCLLRPDGAVWGAGIVLLSFVNQPNKHAFRRELRHFICYLCLPGLFYFAWRAWYFSELLPLPFLVKSSGHRNLILFYAGSMLYVCSAALPVLLAAFFTAGRRPLLRQLAWLFVLPCLFYSAMRLEQNAGNRFLAPMFFGALLLFGTQTKIRPLIALAILSVIFGVKITWQTGQSVAQSGRETVYYVSQDLARLNGKMLVTEAGRLAYYSNWVTHDAWGLNTPRYAHKLIDPNEIEAGSYDLIVAHCGIDQLSRDEAPGAGSPRSWDNLCRTVVYAIRHQQYTILLVPELMKDSDAHSHAPVCQRYDIYALSPSYRDYAALSRLLLSRGAVPYASALKYDDDNICL